MEIEVSDTELAARLRRLDVGAASSAPGFSYDGMIERHADKQTRARRRLAVARGTASALFIALISVSVWRLDRGEVTPLASTTATTATAVAAATAEAPVSQPRIVRANTYLAVAAIEDHIASLDDALSDARQRGGKSEVARLERTRAELVDSWTQVRYAQMVSANF
jgi:hypothetical protein